MKGISSFDAAIAKRQAEAKAKNHVLRYVADVSAGQSAGRLQAEALLLNLSSLRASQPGAASACRACRPPRPLADCKALPTFSTYDGGWRRRIQLFPTSPRFPHRQLTSSIYTAPLVIQGAGAGPDITAAGVVADMVDISLRGLQA